MLRALNPNANPNEILTIIVGINTINVFKRNHPAASAYWNTSCPGINMIIIIMLEAAMKYKPIRIFFNISVF